jgi:RNA polymerase sigma-70 factor (ECF subfamily)
MKFHFFDADYVERLCSGDSQTEQHFVDYFNALIRLKLGRRLRSPSAIEDLRQETITRVWAALRERGRLLRPERLGAFVNSVCNNTLFEHYRKTSREIAMGDEVAINTPDLADEPVDVIADRQLQEAVRKTLNGLEERDRFLLEELFLNERNKDDVCRELGVNREYLRVLLFRAKKSFRAYLEHQAGERQGHDQCVKTIHQYQARQVSLDVHGMAAEPDRNCRGIFASTSLTRKGNRREC